MIKNLSESLHTYELACDIEDIAMKFLRYASSSKIIESVDDLLKKAIDIMVDAIDQYEDDVEAETGYKHSARFRDEFSKNRVYQQESRCRKKPRLTEKRWLSDPTPWSALGKTIHGECTYVDITAFSARGITLEAVVDGELVSRDYVGYSKYAAALEFCETFGITGNLCDSESGEVLNDKDMVNSDEDLFESRKIKSEKASYLLTPWAVIVEYEDGYQTTIGGNSEQDCIEKAWASYLTDKHGDITWYSGLTDSNYEAGERVIEEATQSVPARKPDSIDLIEKDESENIWYALQSDPSDAWDNGTTDKDEALRMLKSSDKYNLIAVINDDTGVCIDEIWKEDVKLDESVNESLDQWASTDAAWEVLPEMIDQVANCSDEYKLCKKGAQLLQKIDYAKEFTYDLQTVAHNLQTDDECIAYTVFDWLLESLGECAESILEIEFDDYELDYEDLVAFLRDNYNVYDWLDDIEESIKDQLEHGFKL